ncbi:aminotransferase class I/II-fold pyridoxal phosphate-dependent enzyme [Streptomyces lunaelactis]|uniref:aminotransferase class I/II-fold pyridoxal phosphate-dependent enzyme n=1 Tax=Streptomyces lunaelactis TaxID=1535768 RepID=UPI001584ECB6|nr:aminotransferase class I/II-fold pyridoxal phosphate-dependent enzyme [Streptomyces lunaelactis]NUK69656.1 aminotransferase class I/II-fold pyridoxal phosphate-dependent enzyme [Streptomyces lunaelactis]NUK81561.1 aminotransferase class I/II-fold pyridoxal phosphate-dependent enzyme [Streptomyces lunaelactis]
MTRDRYHLSGGDPLVADHRIDGTPVVPAATQIDAMLRACDSERPDSQWKLEQVAFRMPLSVPGERIEVETLVTDDGQCSVSSRQADAAGGPDGRSIPEQDGTSWLLHSTARAFGSPLPPPRYLNVADMRAGCAEELPLSSVAAWRHGSGISYGPAYQAIRAAYRGPGRMLVVMRASEDLQGTYFVPPPLLDSVFQTLGILDNGAAGACLPWFVGRIAARRRISGTVMALVELDGTNSGPGGGGVVRGRATVCNQQGEVLLELDRITLKSAVPLPPEHRSAPARKPAGDRSAGRSIQTVTWQRVVPTPEPRASGGATLVVSDEDLALESSRQVVRLAPDELRKERLDALLTETSVREIVYVAPHGVTDEAQVTKALQGVFTLAQRAAAHPPMADLVIVTDSAHRVTGRETVDPLGTALWGLGRTLRIEHPRTQVRLVDLNTDVGSPAPSLDAIRHVEPELARRNGSWHEPSLRPVLADSRPTEFSGGRFLITGGMGGIGLHVAEALTRAGCEHLTLVGRTVPEQGELRQRLDSLSTACDLRIIGADVRSLSEVLPGGERFDGVLHAAGVLSDGLARTLTPEQIDQVFGPKIGGVHALVDALGDYCGPPRFVALFSSISAVHANLGQSAYAAANGYLDGYAARKRAQGEPWYSLGWGLWSIGMGEGIAPKAAAHGIPALSADDGVALLGTALGLPPANYVLSAAANVRDEQMTAVTPEARLWPSLSNNLKRILHVGHVTSEDDLLEMGLDSMMAVEVAASLSADGLDVDPLVFFEHTNIGALLNYLEGLPRTAPETTPVKETSHTPPEEPALAFGEPMARYAVHPQATSGRAAPPTGTAEAPATEEAPAPRSTVRKPPSTASSFIPDWDRFRDVEATGLSERAPAGRVLPTAPPRPRPVGGERPAHPGAPAGGPAPRRTMPGRLSDVAHGTFLDRRIDALSAEDRVVIAEDEYFYEPVIEEASGAWIKFDGRWFLNFASYSYLGLIGHEYINHQAQRAVEQHGTGAHGVRLLAGTLHLHRELELTLARFLGAEDAIVFSSGYMANVATVGALVGQDDVVIGDVYNHASILDGYRLAGAKVITYAHNDLADLERALRKVGGAGRLVVTDAVFSMDGDIADLPGIVQLCERYDAPLMVDEAHSLGVLGATGRGITEHFGMDPARVPVKMGTLSKTVPSAGGYVAGTSDLIFALKNNARGWMFSAATTPAQVAAAKAAIEVLEAAPALTGELRVKTNRYREALRALGFDTLASETPVVPIICSTADQAHTMARLCQGDGLFVQPIVYPAVPRTLPRLRTIVNLSHSEADLDAAVATLEKAGRAAGLIA